MKIKFTWDKTKEVKPYPIKIHNKHGEIVGELLPRSWLIDALGIKLDYPPAIEKLAWLNSGAIAIILKTAWKLGILKDTKDYPDAVKRLLRELEAKSGGTICFACQESSVVLLGRFRGFSCKTRNCLMHGVIIPTILVSRIDEMPDYSLEPELPQLLQFIKDIESNSEQLGERHYGYILKQAVEEAFKKAKQEERDR